MQEGVRICVMGAREGLSDLRGGNCLSANLRADEPESHGRGAEMVLIEQLMMQIGILLLALSLTWMTYLVSRNVLREAADDWRAVRDLLRRGEGNDLR